MLTVAQILRDASQQSIYGDPRPTVDMECAGFCGQSIYSYAEYADGDETGDAVGTWTVALEDDDSEPALKG